MTEFLLIVCSTVLVASSLALWAIATALGKILTMIREAGGKTGETTGSAPDPGDAMAWGKDGVGARAMFHAEQMRRDALSEYRNVDKLSPDTGAYPSYPAPHSGR